MVKILRASISKKNIYWTKRQILKEKQNEELTIKLKNNSSCKSITKLINCVAVSNEKKLKMLFFKYKIGRKNIFMNTVITT